MRMTALYAVPLATLIGCTPVATAPEPTREVDVGADVPLVQPASQTAETQHQGGVTITVAPTRFDTVGRTACVYRFPPTGLASLLVTPPNGANVQTHQRFVEVQYHDIDPFPVGSGPTTGPANLVFLVTIRNGMNRVFRGAGAVVQYNLDSHVQAVEQSSYLEFLNVLIPPNNQAQVSISGPALTSLRDGATFGLFLYDVVTGIDNAGTVTKRDNFEWFFRVTRQQIRLKSSLVSTYVWVPRYELPRIAQAQPDGTQRLISQDRCISNALAEGMRGTPVAHPASTSQSATMSPASTTAAQSTPGAVEPRAPTVTKPARPDSKTAIDSGFAAARDGRNSDAIRFLETAHRENPRHRDVLANLARLYLADSAYGRAIATGRELITVDACDSDGFQVLAGAYGALATQLKSRKRPGASTRDSLRWVGDSAAKYDKRRAAMPAVVSFSAFSPSSTRAEVAGTLTNQSATARSFTVLLKYLDARGTPVTTDTIRTGVLASKSTKEMKSSRSAAGVAAFTCRVS